jgi:hypothetical protein
MTWCDHQVLKPTASAKLAAKRMEQALTTCRRAGGWSGSDLLGSSQAK